MSNTSNVTTIPGNLIQTGTINAAKINPASINITKLSLEPREYVNQIISYFDDYMQINATCRDCLIVGGYVVNDDGDEFTIDENGNCFVLCM